MIYLLFIATLSSFSPFAFGDPIKAPLYRSHKGLTIGLLPELGGRIIELKFNGVELFYQDEKQLAAPIRPGLSAPLCDLFQTKDEMDYRTYGGDKTSVGPQQAWYASKPPLDLDAGAYKLIPRGTSSFALRSPPDRETGIQIYRFMLFLESENRLLIRDCATNVTDQPRQWGVWNISQLLRPAEVYLRTSTEAQKGNFRAYDFMESQEYFPTRVSSADSASGDYVRVDTLTPAGFKFGGIAQPLSPSHLSEIISVQHLGDRSILWHRLFTTDTTAEFAHESSVEVFNFPTDEKPYVEVEVHAPYRHLNPRQKTCLTQLWSFKEIPAGTSFADILSQVRADDPVTKSFLSRPEDY